MATRTRPTLTRTAGQVDLDCPLADVPGVPAAIAGPLRDYGVATVRHLCERAALHYPALTPPASACYAAIRSCSVIDAGLISHARIAADAVAAYLGLPEGRPPSLWLKKPIPAPPPEIPVPPEPGPVVCAPVGNLPLYQVPGIPHHAISMAALSGVTTLGQLAERVERVANATPREALLTVLGAFRIREPERTQAAEAILRMLTVSTVPPAAQPQESDVKQPHLRTDSSTPRAEARTDVSGDQVGADPSCAPRTPRQRRAAPGQQHRVDPPAARSPEPSPRSAGRVDDFDENTPPPRRRPEGNPIPRWVSLPPGEPILPTFRGWERQGRIPPGCILAEFVGTGLATRDTRSGYRLVAYADDSPAGTGRGLGPVGTELRVDVADQLDTVATVREQAPALRWYVVLARREG